MMAEDSNSVGRSPTADIDAVPASESMRLTRVELNQVRQFREPLVLDGLREGINIFSGPNEAGKSTVVAAIRAAFLERHRSSGVEDLRPWGDSSAAPSVDIDFTFAGQRYRLSKRFLQRKRCMLEVGARVLDGAMAEDHLAELMGFRYASRGASDAQHWGVPGLLWIQQGNGQIMRDPIAHATDHLRAVLMHEIDAVTSGGADAVTARVETARNALLTQTTNAARGIYADAIARHTELDNAERLLAAEIATYRDQVDELAALREAHRRDEAEQPWKPLREQQAKAEARLVEIAGLSRAVEDDSQRLKQLHAQAALLREQRETFEAQQTAATMRRAQVDQAAAQSGRAQQPLGQWEARVQTMRAESEAARIALHAARTRTQHQALRQRHLAGERQLTAASLALADARTAHAAWREAREQAADLALDASVLPTLTQQEAALRDLRIRREVAATRLHYAVFDRQAHREGQAGGQEVRIDGKRVDGTGERALSSAIRIDIDEVGYFEIHPGNTDLADWESQETALREAQQALLTANRLASMDAALARHEAAQAAQFALRTARTRIDALAPKGIDALQAVCDTLESDLTRVAQDLAALPVPADRAAALDDDAASVSVKTLEDAEAQARRQYEAATQQWQEARLTAARAGDALVAATREAEQAEALLQAPDRAQRFADVNRQLSDTLAQAATLETRLAEQRAVIAAARPEILRQDVERFGRSATQYQQRFDERAAHCMRLEVTLEAAGAQGLEDRYADVCSELAQARRRRDDIAHRAEALDYLLSVLRDKQKALTRRLHAPLERHIQHYLSLLFPGATLALDEQMQPALLTRPRHAGGVTDISAGVTADMTGMANAGPADAAIVEALSYGAREQLGVITRLAYADLLAEAGRPTLLILDDALVHSDDVRLDQMKRVLFDAGTRHQILLFTCHPERWRDLGVPPIPLASVQNARR